MGGSSCKTALRARSASISAAVLIIAGLGMAAPVQAGRGISIDANTTEIWSDATASNVVALPFADNRAFLVQLPDTFNVTEGQQTFAAVGLQAFLDPSQVLFATVNGTNDSFPQQVPALRLGSTTDSFGISNFTNPTQIAMYGPSDADLVQFPNSLIANVFEFGNVTDANMGSSQIATSPGSDCEPGGGGMLDCYGPFTNSATFEFLDRSGSGSPDDFELIVTCGELCGNIGFNLDGVSFSADDFNPATAPSQLISYSLGTQTDQFHPGTWDFLFTNASAVPEPATWAMMLLGFGVLGGALRRARGRTLQLI